MSNLRITHIACAATSGASIDSCIYEAMKLSLERREDVKFTHNSREYTVKFDDLNDIATNVNDSANQ